MAESKYWNVMCSVRTENDSAAFYLNNADVKSVDDLQRMFDEVIEYIKEHNAPVA